MIGSHPMKMAGLILLLGVLIAACAAPAATGPQIQIQDPWARPGAMGMSHGMGHGGEGTSAVYFVVVNNGDQPDALIGAASDAAEQAELHETVMEGDVAKMRPVPRVEIPAKGRVEFRPRGLHVMLIGLKQDLKVGDTFTVTLRFEKSGEIRISVPVREMPKQP
ncbi:MAG TPA: copper chaperone PCu(A)C [Thermoflexus sp.]|nr:copper chaperone PCu(A)C [Thermoflexus sp.]